MYPPIYATVAAVTACTDLIGRNPVRCYPFGMAPQGVERPYVVWQTIAGSPENYLGEAPDMDSFTLQVDVYADTADSARDTATAIRDAVQSSCHIVGWRGESRDPDTMRYRYSFDIDWWVSR